MRFNLPSTVFLVTALLFLPQCGPMGEHSPGAGMFTEAELRRVRSMSPVGEVPPDETNAVADDSDAVRFGKMLFYEESLSPAGISCATCHDPDKGFGDAKALSEGVAKTSKNAPSLWNVGYYRWYFWDGRADSLWAQAVQPLEADAEMGSDRLFASHAVYNNADLRREYEALFGPMPDMSEPTRFPDRARPSTDPADSRGQAWNAMSDEDKVSANRVLTNLTKSIAAFERTIRSDRSPFDDFVGELGDGGIFASSSLSRSALRGLKIFVGKGRCFLCHSGPNLTDLEFHNLGLDGPAGESGRRAGAEAVLTDPFNALGEYSDDTAGAKSDQIRYLANNDEQLGQFKTPTLRNIARTAPYMHDGRFQTLEEVVRFYNELPGRPAVGHREDFLEPLHLNEMEIRHVVDFLNSLTDESRLSELKP